MNEDTNTGTSVPVSRGVTSLVICTEHLYYLNRVVRDTGRNRAVAREFLRLHRQRFHGQGLPRFGGRAIYWLRSVKTMRRMTYLPIVPK